MSCPIEFIYAPESLGAWNNDGSGLTGIARPNLGPTSNFSFRLGFISTF